MLYANELSQDVTKRVRALIAQYELQGLFKGDREFRDKMNEELKRLSGGFEGISCLFETDQFAKMNYERKHYSKEEQGPLLTKEEVVQYVALQTLLEGATAHKTEYPFKLKEISSYYLSYYPPLVDVKGELFPEVREALSESIVEQYEAYMRHLTDQFGNFKTIELIRALMIQKQVLRKNEAFVVTLSDGILVRQKQNRYKESEGAILPFTEEETAQFLAIDSLLMQLHAQKIVGGQDLSLQF